MHAWSGIRTYDSKTFNALDRASIVISMKVKLSLCYAMKAYGE
jgi:hypothetical protein